MEIAFALVFIVELGLYCFYDHVNESLVCVET